MAGGGFGSGPFGDFPFGEWPWSERVLWELIPSKLRAADSEDQYLQKYMQAQQHFFDVLRLKAQDFGQLRDPVEIRTQFDETSDILLGKVIQEEGRIERQGLDGQVLTKGSFTSPRASFSVDDRGKLLNISRSSVAQNNSSFQIAAVIDRTTVVVEPLIDVDPGLLRWELRVLPAASTQTLTVEVERGDVSVIKPGWILDDGNALFPIVGKARFRDYTVDRPVLRHGQGSIDSSGCLFVATGPFVAPDIGRRIVISGTSEDDGTYEVFRVVSPGVIELASLGGSFVALTAATEVNWSLLIRPRLYLSTWEPPLGVVQQGSVDMAVVGASTVTALSGQFTATDIDKYLYLRGSALGNNGRYLIQSVTSANTLVVAGSLTVESDLQWGVRQNTNYGSEGYVHTRATSLLSHLAKDFGIEVDSQQSELRQRSWVKNTSIWTAKKGTEEAYKIVGDISGFDIEVEALYSVSFDMSSQIPSESLYEVGDSSEGRYGSDGSLLSGIGRTRFSSPSGSFKSSDIGKCLRIRDAADPTNNKLFEIAAFVDANTVAFRASDGGFPPDANNGALLWSLATLFTSLAPTIPLFDELDTELLTAIVSSESGGSLVFTVDRYCWESDWSSDIPVTVNSTVVEEDGLYTVSLEHATGASALASIGSGPNGTINITVDSEGLAGNAYSVSVVASVSPSSPLTTTLLGTSLEISLSSDASGALIAANNTAALIEASINATVGGTFTALALGTKADSFSYSEGPTSFTGGKDVFDDAPTVILEVGRWSLVDSLGVSYWIETVPQAGSGTPTPYSFRVRSLAAPQIGSGVLRYVCEPQPLCWYCPAAVVMLKATLKIGSGEGVRAEERLWERLLLRLKDVTPAHVRAVLYRVTELEASLSLSAEVESGYSAYSAFYAPLTVYDEGEVSADIYPVDTILTAEIEGPALSAVFRSYASVTGKATVV